PGGPAPQKKKRSPAGGVLAAPLPALPWITSFLDSAGREGVGPPRRKAGRDKPCPGPGGYKGGVGHQDLEGTWKGSWNGPGRSVHCAQRQARTGLGSRAIGLDVNLFGLE